MIAWKTTLPWLVRLRVRSIGLILLSVLTLFPGVSAIAGLDSKIVKQFSNAIVRTHLIGTEEGDIPCNKKGTGFFVSKFGHILTAAHNVQPCSDETLGPVRWKTPPKLTVTIFNKKTEGATSAITEPAVIIYIEPQTDLALLRTNVSHEVDPLPLATWGTLNKGDNVTAMMVQEDQTEPTARNVTIDSLFNPNERYKGLIDISVPDMKPSASGGPLFDSSAVVAAVVTKGSGQTGEGAVPISYASNLFQLANISYPSGEVREVIQELRQDLIDWTVKYDTTTRNVTVDFKKRLRGGTSPVQFHATFAVHTKESFSDVVYAFDHTISVSAEPARGKRGRVVFKEIGDEIDEQIKSRNQPSGSDATYPTLGDKKFAKVSLTAEFANRKKIEVLRGYEMDFEQ